MNISPSEIKSIKNIGNLHGEEVKMIATKGGLYLAFGKKVKDKKSHEPLAAASHPALVMHQVEKQFKEFQPTIAKSEQEQMPEVIELPCEIKDLSMFCLKNSYSFDIILTKLGIEICKCECEIIESDLKIKKIEFKTSYNSDVLKSQINNGIVEMAKSQNIKNFIK